MRALAKCPFLVDLDLTGCWGITEEAVMHLVENSASPHLRVIKLKYHQADFRDLKEKIESNYDIWVLIEPNAR